MSSSTLLLLSTIAITSSSQARSGTLAAVTSEQNKISRRYFPSRTPATLQLRRATGESEVSTQISTAADVVRAFYDGANRRDFDSVRPLIAEKCVYEDLGFSDPFVGREKRIVTLARAYYYRWCADDLVGSEDDYQSRPLPYSPYLRFQAILEFFKKFTGSISNDLQFVIDDISNEDTSAIGVTWHLEWRGRAFPFSKGCSFYRLEFLEGKRQLVYGRDCVEPAMKPGEMSLVIIKAVTWLLQRFPNLAERL